MTRFGIALHEASVNEMLDTMVVADQQGIPVVWLTSSFEQMTLFAVAGQRTRHLVMGTAIVPIFPRHPLLLAQQVAVLEAAAPGRLELGIGASHRPIVEGMYGLPFEAPLGRTKEYAQILQQAFQGSPGGRRGENEGRHIDFDGRFYRVHAPGLKVPAVPLLISALRASSFEAAGQFADGGMSWICPAQYLRQTAWPALLKGAQAAGRSKPRLVAHCFLAASENAERVKEDARQRLRLYPTLPFYAAMLQAAGDTGPPGSVSDWLIDAVVAHGSPGACADRLRQFAQTAGADDLIVSLMVVEGDRQAGLRKAIDIVAGLR